MNEFSESRGYTKSYLKVLYYLTEFVGIHIPETVNYIFRVTALFEKFHGCMLFHRPFRALYPPGFC